MLQSEFSLSTRSSRTTLSPRLPFTEGGQPRPQPALRERPPSTSTQVCGCPHASRPAFTATFMLPFVTAEDGRHTPTLEAEGALVPVKTKSPPGPQGRGEQKNRHVRQLRLPSCDP